MELVQRTPSQEGEWVHGVHRVDRCQCEGTQTASLRFCVHLRLGLSCVVERDVAVYYVSVEERAGDSVL